MAKNIAMPDGSVVEFPDTMSDDDIGAAIKKNSAPTPDQTVNAAVASVPRPSGPNPILKAPEESGLETGPLVSSNPDENDTLSHGAGSFRALAREANAAKNSITGIPSSIYHAFADAPTPEETQEAGGPQEVQGAKRVGLGVGRLTSEPIINAAKWYSQAAQGKVPDALNQALSVAPEAIGAGAGNMLAGKAIESARLPQAVSDTIRQDIPARLMNAAVRSRPKGFDYGRNPGAAVAEEGMVAGSKAGLLDQIGQSLKDTGQKIDFHLSDPAVNKPSIDVTNSVIDPLNEMESAAIKNKNLALADKVADLRNRLTHDYARDPNGNLVPTGTTKLVGLTPLEANALKQSIGEMAKWTGNLETDQLSPALREIYGRINGQVEGAAPGIKAINKKYGELLSAHDSLDTSMRLQQGYNPLGSLTDILASLKWGPTGYGVTKALRSTPGLTVAAQALRKSTVPQPLQTAAGGLTVANLKQKAGQQ